MRLIRGVLRDTHAYQVTNYAASGGVNLCILTNGVDYRLYHLTWGAKVEHTLVLSFNMLDDDLDDITQKLYLLSKESFKKGLIDKHVAETTSLGDKNLIRAVFSQRVLTSLRLELKAMTGCNIKDEAICASLVRHFDPKVCEKIKLPLKSSAPKRDKKPITAAPTDPPKLELMNKE